ncbi:uncharacterized protein LOC125057961 isoform X2 [Pieris napi]|uniref:uncharacterized protein LOC125057961 isoform X2 n=1 Tax=Pieris napi TaxID=78633 RepID=UPI001FBA7250|nr:uncharacterized protein LOC125057961 isoform X2 [Pieris napi]
MRVEIHIKSYMAFQAPLVIYRDLDLGSMQLVVIFFTWIISTFTNIAESVIITLKRNIFALIMELIIWLYQHSRSLVEIPQEKKQNLLHHSENDENVDHNYCQLQDDNYCPETVAVEYEIISDNMQISELSNEAIEEVSESGISFISNHFNNRLTKRQPQCLSSQIVTGSEVDSDSKDEQIKSLRKQCRLLKAKLKKQQQRISCYKEEIKKSKYLTKEKFDALTERVPELGKRLMWMQLHQPKKKNGHRFDTKEKLMCLAIKKYKPECFKFLKKTFLMPGNKTLKNFIAKLQLPDSKPEEDEPNIDDIENEEVVSDTLLDGVDSETQISYETHKNVLGEFIQFNNSTNLADFTDFQHGLC